MNRKQKRRLRRHGNRERYLLNRRNWCPVGPPVVMEEPTEEHIKSLLMDWLGPRVVLDEVQKEVSKQMGQRMETDLYAFMAKLAGPIEDTPTADLWTHLIHSVVTKSPAMPFKIAPA